MLALKLATPEDEAPVVNLVFELFKNSIYSKHSYFNRADVEAGYQSILAGGLENGSIILLYNDDVLAGVLICSAVYQMYNRKEKTAVEVVFWIKPEYRSQSAMKMLLKAYKFWAKKTGCTTILYGKLTNSEEAESYIMRKL